MFVSAAEFISTYTSTPLSGSACAGSLLKRAYPVIGQPPVDAGAYQLRVIVDSVDKDCSLVGAGTLLG
jgi:hypothetical protein